MNAETLDRLVADADPAQGARLGELDLRDAMDELAAEVVGDAHVNAPARRPRRPLVALAIGAAAACLAAVVLLVGVGSPGEQRGPEFAEAAIRMAEANPRLLIDDPAWSVVRANELSVREGATVFSDGEHELELTWYPASDFPGYLADRRADDPDPAELEVAGRRALVFETEGTSEIATMLSPSGGQTFAELRGDVGGREAYFELLTKVKQAEVGVWLSALPPASLRPGENTAAVERMVRGIPMPPGLELTGLNHPRLVADRNSLRAYVAGGFACRWMDLWWEGKLAGDRRLIDRATRAMRTSTDWPVLLTLQGASEYPRMVWTVARAMRGQLRGTAAQQYYGGHNYYPTLGCREYEPRP